MLNAGGTLALRILIESNAKDEQSFHYFQNCLLKETFSMLNISVKLSSRCSLTTFGNNWLFGQEQIDLVLHSVIAIGLTNLIAHLRTIFDFLCGQSS